MPTYKTEVIEQLFSRRFNSETGLLTNSIVTLADISSAIAEYNAAHPDEKQISTRNPANFFKDIIRHRTTGNAIWPASVLARGYAARQVTGGGASFEFVALEKGQIEAFPASVFPDPSPDTPLHRIETVSLPLASRRLGRGDEPWLIQVVIRLHVVETHLSLHSARKILQVDHLQMNVKLRKSEVDALFLVVEQGEAGSTRELIVTCEAKSKNEDILEDQIIAQIKAVANLGPLIPDSILPMAIKALSKSRIRVLEFEAIKKADAADLKSLTIASDALYDLVPSVPGIGE